LLAILFQQRETQVTFVRIAAVQCALADASATRDLRHAGLLCAACGKELARGE
jgi:hypothetical protein